MVQNRRNNNISITKMRKEIRRGRNTGKIKPTRPRNRRCRLKIRAGWLNNGGKGYRIIMEWSD